MISKFSRTVMLVAAMLGFLSCGTIGHAAAINCNTGKTRVITSTSFMQTTSVSFVTVPETTMYFTQGATGCVLVQFSSEYDGATTINVRALLDTATLSLTPDVAFGTVVNTPATHSVIFVFSGVPPGLHAVKIEARSSVNGSPVNLFKRTTIVSYVP